MTTLDSYLHVPARSRDIPLCLRSFILALDFAAIIVLFVSIGLYHKWIPSTSYPTTALQPTKHTDWTDPIVLAAVLVSFIWTSSITIRPAWTRKALHLGFYVAFEFICLVWLLACTIPAFMLRESDFENLAAISNTCNMGTVTLTNGHEVPWVCMPHLDTLKKLQIASYSVACVIAVLHFTLFSLDCHSITHLPSQSPTRTALSQSIENGPNQFIAHEDRDSTTSSGSESDSSSQPRNLHEVAEI
ncbi:MAG: hypothetical protein Q9175_005898 [Cornicularia normoerica]